MLLGSTLVDEEVTLSGYALYNVNSSPAICRDPEGYVVGDVFSVDADTFEKIRSYESGNDGKHEPVKVELDNGLRAMAFVVPESFCTGWKKVPGGDWLTRETST